MAPSAPQTFHNITPGRYAQLARKAQAAGIDLSGNHGTASKFGVEVSWNYDPEQQELTLHCLSAPFFMPAETVNAKIRDLVAQTAS